MLLFSSRCVNYACNQAARKIYWSIIDIQKKRKKFPNLTEYLSLSFYQFVLILIDRKIEINDLNDIIIADV